MTTWQRASGAPPFDFAQGRLTARPTSQSATDAVALQFRRLRDQLIDQSQQRDCSRLAHPLRIVRAECRMVEQLPERWPDLRTILFFFVSFCSFGR
jgi:hypothetical protein